MANCAYPHTLHERPGVAFGPLIPIVSTPSRLAAACEPLIPGADYPARPPGSPGSATSRELDACGGPATSRGLDACGGAAASSGRGPSPGSASASGGTSAELS